jgi:hypothetical protein
MEQTRQAVADAREEHEWDLIDEELDRPAAASFSSLRSGPTTQGGTFAS